MNLDSIMMILLCAVLFALIIICVLLAINSGSNKKLAERIRRSVEKEEREQGRQIEQAMMNQRQELNSNIGNVMSSFGTLMSDSQERFREQQARTLNEFKSGMVERLSALEQSSAKELTLVREMTEARLASMQKDNTERLEKMEAIVDEKLQSTLESRISKSFQLVSEQLEKVYKGLGEMQAVAGGVNDLKKVLSNVKTRGILGEVQLGAILSEILSAEQYQSNFNPKPNSNDVVEFAVKLPGQSDKPVYLPIDSKFPGDTYSALLDAYDTGDTEQIKAASNALIARIKSEAKDIKEKYLNPPRTTDFAVLFLPFEGLYAEAVNRGLTETLQRDYKVNLAGPSTMAAFLNSLQMGFKTLAVQQRTTEIWQLLLEFKTEFARYREVLDASQKHLQQASGDIERLIGVRTRSIEKKLDAVESYNLMEPEEDNASND